MPEQEGSSLAAAMYVVMNLLLHHPGRGADREALELSETGLMRALQVYQVGLQREIVSRITGLASPTPVDVFAEELVRCTHE